MKQMIYRLCRMNTGEVLHSGKYQNRKFAIVSLGTHPCAYIENFIQVTGYEEADAYASVHGLFTYLGTAYWDTNDTSEYLGWDYAHFGDRCGAQFEDYEKSYTVEEIFEDVKKAIEEATK